MKIESYGVTTKEIFKTEVDVGGVAIITSITVIDGKIGRDLLANSSRYWELTTQEARNHHLREFKRAITAELTQRKSDSKFISTFLKELNGRRTAYSEVFSIMWTNTETAGDILKRLSKIIKQYIK